MQNEHSLWSEVVGQFWTCAQSQELGTALCTATLDLGADVHTVDLTQVATQAQALAVLAQRLAFPDYFGQNLDALYDLVGEWADRAQAQLDAAPTERTTAPQVWLIKTWASQEKLLFPIQDALKDALDGFNGVALSIIWYQQTDA